MGIAALGMIGSACGDEGNVGGDTASGGAPAGGGGSGGAGAMGGGGSGGAGAMGGATTTSAGGGGSLASSLVVELVPQSGVSGVQRVSFAVPLAPNQLADADRVRVSAGVEIPAARRGLAPRSDGSLRSVQLQIEVDVDAVSEVVVELDADAAGDLSLVPVEDTLVAPDGESGPRVWALLPAAWLSASGVAGPLSPEGDAVGDEAAWASLCNYATWDDSAFFAEDWQGSAGVWLYDRGTVLYRGYARRGDLVPLRSAYVETSLYRNALTGSGSATRNGVPGAADDVKYTYAQNLAIHYLLTGDDRFRESAEGIALGIAELWPSPSYAGGADFWTERHAGFALLAYVWAAMISDDQASTLWNEADEAVAAYLDLQDTYPAGYDDAVARCFAHHADAHGESYGYFGCSPWMSAILADGLDAYATEEGLHASGASAAIVKLGRVLARDGRDPNGIPFYWMGVGTTADETDPYYEHIGESAYVVAMAWHHDGKADADLRNAADDLVATFAGEGVVGQIRSFNWQCRSAVATPWFLSP
jgi:hypothetical protein